MKHVIAIDQGTTGTTVLVINESLDILAKENIEFEQIYPKPGWVEHNPEHIWKSFEKALGKALTKSGIDPTSLVAIGITNQRETSLLWERKTLTPVTNAIVWQDRRTTDICDALKEKGLEDTFKEKTGLVLDPYFSGTKLKWLLDHDSTLRQRSNELAFGTIDSFMVAKLTAGQVHVTDVSNASRTLLMNLRELTWDPSLCQALDIPEELLPTIRTSSEVYGETRDVPGLPNGIPISGMAGDQQSALFGQACFEVGNTKCTYGTGAFILMNTGSKVIRPKSGVLSTCAWKLGTGDEQGEVAYALEGSAFIAGAAIQWLRDGLGFFTSADEVEALAESVPDSGGVILVPALAGLGAPHWRPNARGTISGLTRGTTKAHIARAALEGIALQNADIVRAMEEDSGTKLSSFKVDGGASANNLLMQMQADVLNIEISRPEIIETTALGAAFLAGLGVGLWKSKHQITSVWRENRRFTPNMDASSRATMLNSWNDALQKT